MTPALSIQQQIAEAFAAACPDLATAGVSILCEDALDIATTAASALAKVGCVGIVSTPTFAPAGESEDTLDCTPALEFYETAANRQRTGAVTALSCAIVPGATHIASLPCALSIGCHVTRHASGVI